MHAPLFWVFLPGEEPLFPTTHTNLVPISQNANCFVKKSDFLRSFFWGRSDLNRKMQVPQKPQFGIELQNARFAGRLWGAGKLAIWNSIAERSFVKMGWTRKRPVMTSLALILFGDWIEKSPFDVMAVRHHESKIGLAA